MAPSFLSRSQVNLFEGSQTNESRSDIKSVNSQRSSDQIPQHHTNAKSASKSGRSGISRWMPSSNSPSRRQDKKQLSVGENGGSSTASPNASQASSTDVTDARTRKHLRSKSRALLDSLLPSSASSSSSTQIGSPPEKSFEVLRRPSGDLMRRTVGSPNYTPQASKPTPSEFGKIPGDSPLDREMTSPRSSSIGRRPRQISNPPSSTKLRGPFDALTRRMSGLSVHSFAPATPGHTFSPLEAHGHTDNGGTGSFTLRSMRNVRHGSNHALDEPVGSYFSPLPGQPAASSSQTEEVFTPESPVLSPAFDDPLAMHDVTAPSSPTASARKMYMDPAISGSSISVAKFKAGRNRTESGSFTPHLDGAAASRAASPGPGVALNSNGLTPAEQLALLEAELAKGGRATPLLRHWDESRQSRVREKSVYEDAPSSVFHGDDGSSPLNGPVGLSLTGLSPVTFTQPLPSLSRPDDQSDHPPEIPDKDDRASARRSLQLSSIFDRLSSTRDTPSVSPKEKQRRFSDRMIYGFEGTRPLSTNGSLAPAFDSRDASPGHVSPATPASPRGRGMDSATFLKSFEGGKPKTLLDALSQIESQRQGNPGIAPPPKPWMPSSVEGRNPHRASTLPLEPSSGSTQPIASSGPAPLHTPPVSAVEAGMMAQASRAAFQPAERVPATELMSPSVLAHQEGATTTVNNLPQMSSTPETGSKPISPPEKDPGSQSQARETSNRDPVVSQAGYFDISPRQQKQNQSIVSRNKRASEASVGTPILSMLPTSNLVVVNASPADDLENQSLASVQDHQRYNHQQTVSAQSNEIKPPSEKLVNDQRLGSSIEERRHATESGPSAPHATQRDSSSSSRGNYAHRKALSVGYGTHPPRRRSEESPQQDSSARQGRPQQGPVRASTLNTARRDPPNSSVAPAASSSVSLARSTSKSAELLSFHARQARAIASAQAQMGTNTSLALPGAHSSGKPPPGIDVNFFVSLPPQERAYLQGNHDQAVLAARAAYQQAYDSIMEPILARLPPGCRTAASPLYTAPSPTYTARSAGGSTAPTPSPIPPNMTYSNTLRPQDAASTYHASLAPSSPGHPPTSPASSSMRAPSGLERRSFSRTSSRSHDNARTNYAVAAAAAAAAAATTTAGPAAMSDRRGIDSSGVDITRRPSAKFMAPPSTSAVTQPSLPAIDGYGATRAGGTVTSPLSGGVHSAGGLTSGAHGSSGGGALAPAPGSAADGQDRGEESASNTLTDALKRRTAARGGEPGEYSVTKRDID